MFPPIFSMMMLNKKAPEQRRTEKETLVGFPALGGKGTRLYGVGKPHIRLACPLKTGKRTWLCFTREHHTFFQNWIVLGEGDSTTSSYLDWKTNIGKHISEIEADAIMLAPVPTWKLLLKAFRFSL